MASLLDIVWILIVVIVIVLLLKFLFGILALVPFELNTHQEANIVSSLLPSYHF